MKKWNNVEELWTGGSSSAKPSSDVGARRNSAATAKQTKDADMADLSLRVVDETGQDVTNAVEDAKPAFQGGDAPWVRASLGAAAWRGHGTGRRRSPPPTAPRSACRCSRGDTRGRVKIVRVVMNVTDALDGKSFD